MLSCMGVGVSGGALPFVGQTIRGVRRRTIANRFTDDACFVPHLLLRIATDGNEENLGDPEALTLDRVASLRQVRRLGPHEQRGELFVVRWRRFSCQRRQLQANNVLGAIVSERRDLEAIAERRIEACVRKIVVAGAGMHGELKCG